MCKCVFGTGRFVPPLLRLRFATMPCIDVCACADNPFDLNGYARAYGVPPTVRTCCRSDGGVALVDDVNGKQ